MVYYEVIAAARGIIQDMATVMVCLQGKYGCLSIGPSLKWLGTGFIVTTLQVLLFSSPVLAAPEPAGWYAGDPHVHRSCGGAPVGLTTLLNGMSANNLAVISVLADMGNGEVQDPATDLPLVTGQDDPVSVAGRIVHWDAEWHWDATYSQFEHQALGRHILALGLNQAYQIWEEYTYPILDWAHQRGGIAGFAHMQYLEDGIPQTLDCCKPLEYPVEVALGAADFISEDVTGSDSVVHAYYRLLNTGFRPGFAAGTDYPCNSGAALGTLLTYVQVADGQMTYENWIEGIAKGRTVVSRNGHREFLDLQVAGNATPGDELSLNGGGSVLVDLTWTAQQRIRGGRIELVQNGVVVVSKQATVTATVPVTLTVPVNFSKSGWLAARRMDSGGHKLHTGAVFVTVDGAPIRASATDALFYVDWIDNLLRKTKTAVDAEWSSFFTESRRAEVHARYEAAKAIYQQRAAEASSPPNPGGSQTIFTNQRPTLFEQDASYELGTLFWSDVRGSIAGVRIYSHAAEGGAHTVRIWNTNGSVVAGPYQWNINAGNEGWKTFDLPAPVAINANTNYIVSVSNSSSDRYYAEQPHAFDTPIVSGNLHTKSGSGVWTNIIGTMPTFVWENTSYFRDVNFVPK